MTEWLPCVVSDDNWRVNEHIKRGDHICRIFNDKIDIKAIMTIKSLGWSKISLHLTDIDADILDIKVDEKLRVCQTSSENDPGTLVVKREMHFNEALKSRVCSVCLQSKWLIGKSQNCYEYSQLNLSGK